MGVSAQLGLVEEVTYGTYVAPTRFFEFVDESLVFNIERLESEGWRPGTRVVRTGRWRAGQKSVAGDITLELQNKSMGLLFKHMLGAIATTTPGGGVLTRDHTATLGDLKGKSFTIQVGRDDRTPVTRAFSYLGCKIQTWEISCAVGEIGRLSLGVLGRDETTAQTLASATYASGLELFTFVEGALTVAAVSTPVREASISGDNRLPDDDYALGSALMREPLEPALREITGSLDADFTDLTAYNRFINGTEATLNLVFTGSLIEGALNYKIDITANVRFDGITPTATGPQEIRLPLAFKVVAPAAGDPISIVFRTTDTAP